MTVSANDEKSKRALTPARIVALVLIGLLVLGLGYVRLGSGDDAVSVPSGAQAGDIVLEDCDYATEKGNYDAECGTLVVPENRHEADSCLIALPVRRGSTAMPNSGTFSTTPLPRLCSLAWTCSSN